MSKSNSIDQLGWTQRFIESSGRPSVGHSFDLLHKAWWFNPLNSSSMRLTTDGASYATTHAKIHYYIHNLEKIILPKTLLQMEKILDYPYYIPKVKTIVVFDEMTSVTLTLYNNDLQTYLDNAQKFS